MSQQIEFWLPDCEKERIHHQSPFSVILPLTSNAYGQVPNQRGLRDSRQLCGRQNTVV